jgi:hypothetical protein
MLNHFMIQSSFAQIIVLIIINFLQGYGILFNFLFIIYLFFRDNYDPSD